jgi:N-acetylhexosamine 1-kinase
VSTEAARAAALRFGWTPRSIEPVTSGHIHATYVVTAPGGPFVLQRINRAVFGDVGALTTNLLVVHRHLRGALVPEPVPDPGGAWLVEEGAGTWRAFRRVVDAAPASAGSAEVAAAAGALLGTFHARLADLDPSRLALTMPGFHDIDRRLAVLGRTVAADPCGRVASSIDEIDAVRASSWLSAEAAGRDREAPVRVAHNDAKLDNFLFRGNEACCIVDLDTVMPGTRMWDVGDLLRTAAATVAEDHAGPRPATADAGLSDAVLSGYRRGVSAGPVSTAELEALEVAGAVVTYEQGVRFLTDWLAGDVYYRVSRPRQNLDRARTQLQLLASMTSRMSR